MAYEFNGSSQGISMGSAVLTASPLTLAGMFYPDTTSAAINFSILALSSSSSDTAYYLLSPAGSVTGDPLRFITSTNGVVNGVAVASAAFVASVWQHAVGLTAATDDRAAFINGGSKGVDSTNLLPLGIDRSGIGYLNRPTPGVYMDGLLAETAIWNVALTDAEIASLAKGFSPRRIRPRSLVFYAPLLRNLQDLRKGLALTAVNAPTVAAHPRVY